jgi:protein-tyrosine phosphatase
MSNWFRTYGFGEILERFLIGAYPTDPDDVRMLEWMGVKRILNLVEDREYGRGERELVENALREAGIDEHRIRLTDYGNLPPEQLEEAVTKINRWLDQGLTTYMHCRAGWQRSAAIAAGVVATRQQIDVEDALRFVKQAKPSADPLAHQREDLLRWYEAKSASGDPPRSGT